MPAPASCTWAAVVKRTCPSRTRMRKPWLTVNVELCSDMLYATIGCLDPNARAPRRQIDVDLACLQRNAVHRGDLDLTVRGDA